MRTQQELTALGEVLKTYELKSTPPSAALSWGCFIVSLLLIALGFYFGLMLLMLVALLPLAYGLLTLHKTKKNAPTLSITIHQKGVNPIVGPYNKAWLFEDIEYNYMFHTGVAKADQPYNNLAFRRNDQNPWFVIPAEMPHFTDFLQTYLTLYYEHRFPRLLKKIMLGQTISFPYVVEDAVLVQSFIEATFDTPTKTLTLSQEHITVDGETHRLTDLKLNIINKQKNFIALTDHNGRLIFGNDYMGLFNHILFIDLLTHLLAVQTEA